MTLSIILLWNTAAIEPRIKPTKIASDAAERPSLELNAKPSEIISITPPTGGENYMPYYIIALISLGVLSIGIMLIKKYIINKKNNA